MVRKIGLFFAYSAFFVLMVLFFIPKDSLYYFAEKELKKNGVIVSDEVVKDRGFTLELSDATLYVKAIKSAHIDSVEILPLLVFNSIDLHNIVLAKTFKVFVPQNIASVHIKHTIFDPLHIYATAKGDFGDAKAVVDTLKRVVHIDLSPSKKMLQEYKTALRELKKSKNGVYSYDAKF